MEKTRQWRRREKEQHAGDDEAKSSFDGLRQRALEEHGASDPFFSRRHASQEHAPGNLFSSTTSTIRSVTPEPAPDATPQDRKNSVFTASPPSSPPQAVRHRHSQREMRRPSSLRTTSDNNNNAAVNGNRTAVLSPFYAQEAERLEELRRPSSARPRTRTLEERARETSPSAMIRKARNRVASVASTASTPYYGNEEPVTSIGHPSTIPQPSAPSVSLRTTKSNRNRLAKQPPQQHGPRPASPVSASASQIDLPPRAIPTTNARKIFHLMRSTCGRMEGLLAFRRGETSPWGLAYCIINDESGSLVYEPKSDASYYRTLISDLRGCEVRTALDPESHHPYLDVIPSSSHLEVHLRPHSQDEFESWFAALLCWQPIRPKGIMNKMAKSQLGLTPERRPFDSNNNDNRRLSEVSLKESRVIKVGKMIFWDSVITSEPSGFRGSGRTRPQRSGRRWKRVSCTLREDGELKMYSETDAALVSAVQLAQLSRCAIQRLHSSVLDAEFSMAIYPQYMSGTATPPSTRPIFLSMESRMIYESWLVLLRAFTVPQLYGPKVPFDADDSPPFPPPPSSDMFRMERSLTVRVIQARMMPPASPTIGTEMHLPRHPNDRTVSGGLYAEVLLDGESRAKSAVRSEGTQPFWREDFNFLDLPAALSVASIRLKERPDAPAMKERAMREEAKRMHDAMSSSTGSGSVMSGSSTDLTVGQVDVYLDDLEASREVEKWWPLTNRYGQNVGEIQIGIRAEEAVILMARDYQPLSELLHRFTNGLTLQIAQVLSGHLVKLSEHLLNIFQVSGKGTEWLMTLIEEEIDSAGGQETPRTAINRLRFSKKIGSNSAASGSREGGFGDMLDSPSNADRELFVRDMGKNAAVEANLLFRANTLCTKSIDLHMRRLGREYLDQMLGDKIREIADKDPDCEVDPNRVEGQGIGRNWERLLEWTLQVWKCIHASWQYCPPELRLIFRHVKACAEDRFGDFLRTVRYSSVSGFLFLRFFCPAILGPKLFGLLKDDPKPKARRALTLIAKIIMSLANVATFGVKEPFMDRANTFLNAHRQEFKDFIDNICSIPSSTAEDIRQIPPSYSTPLQILGRLPHGSREGFPSLPFLIDHARNFADLVELWLENTKSVASTIQGTDHGGELVKFHNHCLALRQRTQDVLAHAERAERPNSNLEAKWEQLVEDLARDMNVSVANSPQNAGGLVGQIYAAAPGSSHSMRGGPGAAERVGTGGTSMSSSTSQYAASESTMEEQWGMAERGMGSLDINGHAVSIEGDVSLEDEAEAWKNAAYLASATEGESTTALPRFGEQNGEATVRGRERLHKEWSGDQAAGKEGKEGKEGRDKMFSFPFKKRDKKV